MMFNICLYHIILVFFFQSESIYWQEIISRKQIFKNSTKYEKDTGVVGGDLKVPLFIIGETD